MVDDSKVTDQHEVFKVQLAILRQRHKNSIPVLKFKPSHG